MSDKIKTTVYIKPHLKQKIYDVALACNTTMSDIVSRLIYKIMNNPRFKPKMLESVKYQEKNKLISWKKLHVSYEGEVYEVANDLRKLLKKSVSKIIAEGIEKFLDEIVRDLCKNKKRRDNYFPSYVFASKSNKKTYSFTIFWGIPILEILENYTSK